MTISEIYYKFIVWFTIGLEFLFITFLLQFFLVQMSSLSVSSSAIYSSTLSNHIIIIFIGRYNIGMFESCYASRVFIESTAVWCCHGFVPSKARNGIPSELLYADNLVLMVMVGSSDGDIIVNSGHSIGSRAGKHC